MSRVHREPKMERKNAKRSSQSSHEGDAPQAQVLSRPKKAPKTTVSAKRSCKRRRPTTSESSAAITTDEGDDEADFEDADEDDNEDTDQPAVVAPSRWNALFEAGPDPIFNESNFFDSDDNYSVPDVSDSEDEQADNLNLQRDMVDMLNTEEMVYETGIDQYQMMEQVGFQWDPEHDFLNNYHEFSDDSSTPSLDMNRAVEEVQRRVHFAERPDMQRISAALSPTMTRNLLPMALIDGLNEFDNQNTHLDLDVVSTIETDGEATEEDLPDPQIVAEAKARQAQSEADDENTPVSRKKERRGPRAGVFVFDKDKPWAVLGKCGTKLLYGAAPNSDSHDWLNERPQSAASNSATISQHGAVFNQSNAGAFAPNHSANVMMGALTSPISTAATMPAAIYRGAPTGPAEAFFAWNTVPAGYQQAGDYIVAESDVADMAGMAGTIDVENYPGGVSDVSLSSLYGDLIDDEQAESPSPDTLNLVLPDSLPDIEAQFAHLNGSNVNAWRDRQRELTPERVDREFFSTGKSPFVKNFTTHKPTRGHKRKASNIPYKGDHYKGVTPVSRRTIKTPNKRRKTTN